MKLALEDETLKTLQALCAKYSSLGYEKLKIEYSGSGDSGETKSIAVVYPGGEEKQLPKDEAQFIDYDFVDAVIEQAGYSGYENNDGGQGVITLDLATGAVHVEHGTNYIQVEEEEADFTLFGEVEKEGEEDDEPAA